MMILNMPASSCAGSDWLIRRHSSADGLPPIEFERRNPMPSRKGWAIHNFEAAGGELTCFYTFTITLRLLCLFPVRVLLSKEQSFMSCSRLTAIAAKPPHTPHRSVSPNGSISDQKLDDRPSQRISSEGEPNCLALLLPHPKRIYKACKFSLRWRSQPSRQKMLRAWPRPICLALSPDSLPSRQ